MGHGKRSMSRLFYAAPLFRCISNSLFNPFTKDEHMITIIMAKGRAAAIEAVCKTSNPPARSNTQATADWMTPHVTLILFEGFNVPPSLNIPNTNVDVSATVT